MNSHYGRESWSSAVPTLGRYQPQFGPRDALRRKIVLTAIMAAGGAFYGALLALLLPSFTIVLLVPIALLALLVIWALPDTGWDPSSNLERLLFCFFVSVAVWPYYLAIKVPGMPLIEIRRVFSLLMVLVLLAGLSMSGRFRGELRDILRANSVLVMLLLAFVALQAVSILFAANTGKAISAFVRYQFGWTAVFFVSAYVFTRPRRVVIWAWTLIGLAAFLTLVGFAESRNQAVLWANHIPWFLKVSDPAMEMLLGPRFREGAYRVVTTFSTSLSFAEFLALTMPFALHMLATSKGNLPRLFWLTIDILLLAGVLLTQSRNGMIGVLLAHAGYGFFWALHRWRTQPRSLVAPALVVAFPALLAGLVVAVLTVGRLRIMTLGGGVHAASNQGRLEQLEAAMPVLARSPVFGHGPQQGASALGYTNPAGVQSIDSYVLAVLLDYGLLGFIIYYGLLVVALAKALRIGLGSSDCELALALPAAAAIMVWIVSKLVLAQEDSSTLLFMILGLIVALSYRARAAKIEQTIINQPQSSAGRLLTT